MNFKVLIKCGVLIAVLGISLYAGISLGPKEINSIWIDADRPLSIKHPFTIEVVGNNAERGLYIAPFAGGGWRGEAGGEAAYAFHVSSPDTYQVWAYCLWHDACTNAVFAQFDDMEKAIVGNDPIFNEWHWVRAFDVKLSEGRHLLQLSNHSDNIAIQKVWLTNDPQATPDGHDVSSIELFYDGFNGCDNGNFASWRQVSGQWEVIQSDTKNDLGQKALVGESIANGLIFFQNDTWKGYSFDVSVGPLSSDDPSASVGICFGMKSQQDYFVLRLSEIGNDASAHVRIEKRDSDGERLLSEFIVPWRPDVWHEVQIDTSGEDICVQIDGIPHQPVAVSDPVVGGVGFVLSGEITAQFDNIHVRSITDGQADISN